MPSQRSVDQPEYSRRLQRRRFAWHYAAASVSCSRSSVWPCSCRWPGIAVHVSRASRAGPSVPSSATLVLRPGGELQEVVPDDVVGQLLGREVDTVRGFVDSLRKAKRDPRIKTVLLMPSALQLPYWAKVQELRDAVARLPQVGQDGRGVPRIRRRPRVLPGQRRRQGLPAADQPARSHRRRLVRDLPARHVRQDRRVSGLHPHRRLQDRRQPAHREGLHAGAPRDVRVAQPRHVRRSSCAASPRAARRPSRTCAR